MNKRKVNKSEENLLFNYRSLSFNHQVLLEGLAEWLEVLEALEDEGKEVYRATVKAEHSEHEVRLTHVWKLVDMEDDDGNQ